MDVIELTGKKAKHELETANVRSEIKKVFIVYPFFIVELQVGHIYEVAPKMTWTPGAIPFPLAQPWARKTRLTAMAASNKMCLIFIFCSPFY